MRMVWATSVFIVLIACQGKLDTKETGSSAVTAAGASDGNAAAKSDKKLETVPVDVVAGLWASDCLPKPENTIQPGTTLQYQFGADGAGTLKVVSYRDAGCEQRYTKADVEKLKTRLQAEAQANGLPALNESELKLYDTLWLPPLTKYQFKLGRKFTNGLMEIDMTAEGADGPMPTLFTTFFLENGILYFAQTCSSVDNLAAICAPISGDSSDRRGKKVEFGLGFYKQGATP